MALEGIKLGHVFVLEQMQNVIGLLTKLFVTKSIKTGRDLIFQFASLSLDNLAADFSQEDSSFT